MSAIKEVECNSEAPSSRLALTACWICSWQSRVQILGHASKQPTGLLQPVGIFNDVMFLLNYLFH